MCELIETQEFNVIEQDNYVSFTCMIPFPEVCPSNEITRLGSPLNDHLTAQVLGIDAENKAATQ